MLSQKYLIWLNSTGMGTRRGENKPCLPVTTLLWWPGESLQGRIEENAWIFWTLSTSVPGCFLSTTLGVEGDGDWEEGTVIFPHGSGRAPVGWPPSHHGQALLLLARTKTKTGALFIFVCSCLKGGSLFAWRWGYLFPLSRILSFCSGFSKLIFHRLPYLKEGERKTEKIISLCLIARCQRWIEEDRGLFLVTYSWYEIYQDGEESLGENA